MHVRSKEERIKTLIRNAFMRVFVRPVGFKSVDEQLEVHFKLFLTQVQSKQETEESEEAASEPSQTIEQEFEDETQGPMVLRPSREDIHAILIRACKIEEINNINIMKA